MKQGKGATSGVPVDPMWSGDRDLEAGGPSREDSGSESLSKPGTAPGPLGCSAGNLRNPCPPHHPSAGPSVVTRSRNGAAARKGVGERPVAPCGNSAEQSLTTGPLCDSRRVSSVTRASLGGRLSPTRRGQMGFTSSPGLRLSRLPAAPSSLEPTAGLAACAEWQPLGCLKPSSSQRPHSLGRSCGCRDG